MRYSWMTLAGMLLAGAGAYAQQPAQQTAPPQQQAPPQTAPPQQQQTAPPQQQAPATPPPSAALDPAHNPLDALLVRWEERMTQVQTIIAHCTRTSVDKTFNTADVYEGAAKYMKPNLAMLEMQKKGKPQVFEKYVCTGTYLYEFVPAEKVIRVHELPPPKPGQVSDDNFLSFLFGMRAAEAKRRYDLKLVKQDQWYYYIEILPRFPADKADFQKARLVLTSSTFLPRELWFEQPNGNEVKWDMPKVESGADLRRTDFTSPATPPGWNLVRVPRNSEASATNVPPRVVRPKQ
jgi:TIGR03009 family protein